MCFLSAWRAQFQSWAPSMLIKTLTFLVTEMAQGYPSWGAMFPFFVPLAPFGPSLPPKLNFKKRRIRVYYCYRGGGLYE